MSGEQASSDCSLLDARRSELVRAYHIGRDLDQRNRGGGDVCDQGAAAGEAECDCRRIRRRVEGGVDGATGGWKGESGMCPVFL